jgi:limonene-1,2-epoxide hydrolase
MTRRGAILSASAALAALTLSAEERNTAESANVQLVTEFCAAMSTHDLEKVMSFFADNSSYRVTETQEPAKGKQAVSDRINSYLNRVGKFEILETFARGPMVFNQRIDHFTAGALHAWHGMGVFFVKDGKIVEWNDYTISVDRG